MCQHIIQERGGKEKSGAAKRPVEEWLNECAHLGIKQGGEKKTRATEIDATQKKKTLPGHNNELANLAAPPPQNRVYTMGAFSTDTLSEPR